ncbi:MAG: hypothetical protein VX061_10695 [Pseudomonadota bacterium]|nr:hypothetical protein [Pseudomonadota bacterium]
MSCSEKPENTASIDTPTLEDDAVVGIKFYRKSEAKRLIIFVHGFIGDAKETWLHDRTSSYWPELITTDEAFSEADVATYRYESSLFEQSFSIDEIADNLRLRLNAARVPEKYDEVVFLTHSMGGLVTRAFALKFRDLLNIRAIYFFATPTNGADLANLASLVPNSKQVEGLKNLQESLYLQSQSSQWLASEQHINIRSYCAYETKTTSGILVVPRQSATALCNQRLDPIAENHTRIVKPSSIHSDAYVAFKVAYEETFERLQLIKGRQDITIDSSNYKFPNNDAILTADKLRISVNYRVPNDALIVANSIEFTDGAALTGNTLSIVTASTVGGTIDVSGDNGKDGGQLLLATGRISGTRILANGGDGLNGKNGRDGRNGENGADGRNGSCKGFGGWRKAKSGGSAKDGTNGQDGTNGGDGGDGGSIYLVSLNESFIQPAVYGGTAGVGGEGGREGRGGKGGRGGRGCSGLGGSQENANSGRDGLDGLPGQRGASGKPGSEGTIWVNLVDSMKEIAKHIPEADEVRDYKADIINNLKATAQSR